MDEETIYLDKRYDLICCVIQEFFDWYDKACTPDNDTINAFICERSKEVDNFLQIYEETGKEVDIEEALEEIQAICIGADSPDANWNAEHDPIDELFNCQQDLGAISNIVEEILTKIKKQN